MGMFERLELRDLEILRTMARVHFLTSAEINAAFFSSEYAGYRRLKKLAEMNLIRRHTNGAPPRTNYCAWRLTGAGIEAVLRAYPEEPIREGLDERLSRKSIADFEHREAISRLYLDLIRGSEDERSLDVVGSSCMAVRKRAAAVRARADRFQWRADGDVVVEMHYLAERFWIVPDATASNSELRLFIELDRSNKSLKRIEENLKRYQRFIGSHYGDVFPDRKPAWVVYVVRSRARQANIAKLAAERLSILNPIQTKVLLMGQEASTWLASMLLGEERKIPVDDKEAARTALVRDAFAMLESTDKLLGVEQATFANLSERNPELLSQWKRTVGILYAGVKSESRRGR